jgi:outer membrane protein assembly factor BamB
VENAFLSDQREVQVTKQTHLFLTAVALTVAAAMLLLPGTAAAFPADTSPVSAASPGSVQWRFQVSGSYVVHGPVVGPDGGVVVASASGNVYSLTSAGALRWVVPAGADGLSIGADGTVYVGSMNTITAIAPNGSVRWTFTEPSVGQGVIAGPTVGPDGNIYVISDYGGLGAFALSPAGQLLWSNSASVQAASMRPLTSAPRARARCTAFR